MNLAINEIDECGRVRPVGKGIVEWSPSSSVLRGATRSKRWSSVRSTNGFRSAYLAISQRLLRERYGKRLGAASEEVRRRAERDLWEYRALVRR
jgi:hypothetical protein